MFREEKINDGACYEEFKNMFSSNNKYYEKLLESDLIDNCKSNNESKIINLNSKTQSYIDKGL